MALRTFYWICNSKNNEADIQRTLKRKRIKNYIIGQASSTIYYTSRQLTDSKLIGIYRVSKEIKTLVDKMASYCVLDWDFVQFYNVNIREKKFDIIFIKWTDDPIKYEKTAFFDVCVKSDLLEIGNRIETIGYKDDLIK